MKPVPHKPTTFLWGALRVTAALALLVGAALFIYPAIVAHNLRSGGPLLYSLTGPDSSTSSAPVEFMIGAISMRIPRNYFARLPERAWYFGKRGEQEYGAPDEMSFSLQLSLPDFEPRTNLNTGYLDKSGWSHKIMISVLHKSHSLTGASLFNSFYKNQYSVTEGQYGYKEFRGSQKGSVGYFKGTIDKPHDFIICTEDKPGSSPYCERHIGIAPNIVVHYVLSEKHLSDIVRIEQKLIEILNGFVVTGGRFALVDENLQP